MSGSGGGPAAPQSPPPPPAPRPRPRPRPAPAHSSHPPPPTPGNHDALGNVSAEIAYSARSASWTYPDFYYAVSHAVAGSGETVEILMLDTTLCYGIWSDPAHDAMCAAQLAWFAAAAGASTADYLLVAGHYPAWSACAHGNTDWVLSTLLPTLHASNVTAYLSGHDHCQEVIAPDGASDLVFLVTGAGDGCCYAESNVAGVPAGSLKYLLSAGVNPTNASGGFASLHFGPPPAAAVAAGGAAPPSALTIVVRDEAGGVLYMAPPLLPRVRDGRGGVRAPDYRAAGVPRPSDAAPVTLPPHERAGAGAAGRAPLRPRMELPLAADGKVSSEGGPPPS